MEQTATLTSLLAHPDKPIIFLTQFFLSMLVFVAIARPLAKPWLEQMDARTALMILLFPHAFRHIGLSFLVPGLVSETIPESFAVTAGYGDLLAALTAMFALFALKGRWRIAIPAVWVASIVGLVDLANALRQEEAIMAFRSTWYIPTFLVPLLITTHFMVMARIADARFRHNVAKG